MDEKPSYEELEQKLTQAENRNFYLQQDKERFREDRDEYIDRNKKSRIKAAHFYSLLVVSVAWNVVLVITAVVAFRNDTLNVIVGSFIGLAVAVGLSVIIYYANRPDPRYY